MSDALGYAGKQVVITGKVELYQGSPQIKLTDPKQVRVLDGKPGEGDADDFSLELCGGEFGDFRGDARGGFGRDGSGPGYRPAWSWLLRRAPRPAR